MLHSFLSFDLIAESFDAFYYIPLTEDRFINNGIMELCLSFENFEKM